MIPAERTERAALIVALALATALAIIALYAATLPGRVDPQGEPGVPCGPEAAVCFRGDTG